jgi:hypothetical protein
MSAFGRASKPYAQTGTGMRRVTIIGPAAAGKSTLATPAGRSSTLELTPGERSVLTDSLRRSRARARAAVAAHALAQSPVRARLRLAQLALTPGLDFASRQEIARLAADFGRRQLP